MSRGFKILITGQRLDTRVLTGADLDAMAELNIAAFPRSALCALGHEAVRRYYRWQLFGPHDVEAWGVFGDRMLLGFAVGGTFRHATSGYLRRNLTFLATRIALRPWLLGNPLIRSGLADGLRILRRFGGKVDAHAGPPAPSSSFGVLAIAVSPAARRMGIGRTLMQLMETAADRRGADRMALTVDPDNVGAVRFYRSLGFGPISPTEPWDGRMVKALRVP